MLDLKSRQTAHIGGLFTATRKCYIVIACLTWANVIVFTFSVYVI